MHVIPLTIKNRLRHLPLLIPRTPTVKKLLFCACFGEIFLVSVALSSTTFPAKTVSPTSPRLNLVVWGKTESLIHRLESAGLNPLPLAAMNHRPLFSATGTLVMMHGDTIQIFEYEDASRAEAESMKLVTHYEKRPSNDWRKPIHLYRENNLLVFYMGDKDEIITALKDTIGTPILGDNAFVATTR